MPLPPHLVAELDQRSAQAGEALDESIAYIRGVLAAGVSPEAAAEILAYYVADSGMDVGKVAVGYAHAVVRLAQQPDVGAAS